MLIATLLYAQTVNEETVEIEQGKIKDFTCLICESFISAFEKIGAKDLTLDVMMMVAKQECEKKETKLARWQCQKVLDKFGRQLFEKVLTEGLDGACESVKMCDPQ